VQDGSDEKKGLSGLWFFSDGAGIRSLPRTAGRDPDLAWETCIPPAKSGPCMSPDYLLFPEHDSVLPETDRVQGRNERFHAGER
jgi:hypothetical protein